MLILLGVLGIVALIVITLNSRSKHTGSVVDYTATEFYEQEVKENEDKEPNRSTRDLRNQGAEAIGSDFKGSALPQSGSSESLREARDPMISPTAVERRRAELASACQDAEQMVRRVPTSRAAHIVLSARERELQQFEDARARENEVQIELRSSRFANGRTGRQFMIRACPAR